MKKEITFHINNLAYTINVEDELARELRKFLTTDKNISTRELLLAYIQKTQEFMSYKKDLEKISNKLPPL